MTLETRVWVGRDSKKLCSALASLADHSRCLNDRVAYVWRLASKARVLIKGIESAKQRRQKNSPCTQHAKLLADHFMSAVSHLEYLAMPRVVNKAFT